MDNGRGQGITAQPIEQHQGLAWHRVPRGWIPAWSSPVRTALPCDRATSASISVCWSARPTCHPSGSTTCVTAPLPTSFAAGVDIKVVQEMLGHATSAFTRDVYTNVVPEIATAAAEAVASIVPRRANNVPAKAE